MAIPFAEVIGDPVAHSRSPQIHKSWLASLGIEGDYCATRVPPDELGHYFSARRADPDWRGCNVTIPHKEKVLGHLDRIVEAARSVGAVNCITVEADRLVGRNTDIDGIAQALAGSDLAGGKAVVIGAGGAARAVVHHLLQQQTRPIVILARDPEKAAALVTEARDSPIDIRPLGECHDAVWGASLVVNASAMGMDGCAPMPRDLLDCVAAQASGSTFFDMVYQPLETEFLAVGRANGAATVDGLAMLIGQARSAFRHFFGHLAPHLGGLRDLLVT